ncbi:hypothetical protein ACFSL4_19280 [Streptomyces caeni]|uniref:Uncharacterized protein n=1 Tax=Streptomyces caeni TaxID=2307231 RepID=A0ABW4ISD4_9ACTN
MRRILGWAGVIAPAQGAVGLPHAPDGWADGFGIVRRTGLRGDDELSVSLGLLLLAITPMAALKGRGSG